MVNLEGWKGGRVNKQYCNNKILVLGSIMHALDKQSCQKICSGQVITDLSSIAKELIENSIDAGCNFIEIKIKNYGCSGLEVSDDGHGINPQDFPYLCLPHYTSKLQSFEQLQQVTSLGFRGEALGSICTTSDLEILTSSDNSGLGTRLSFDKNGKLLNQTKASVNRGTIVLVSNLFSNLPVRKKYLEQNCRREFSKFVTMVQSFAILNHNVRFLLVHQTTSSARQIIFQTSKSNSLKKAIIEVFGSSLASECIIIDHTIDLIQPKTTSSGINNRPELLKIKLEGMISNPNTRSTRTSSLTRSIYSINGRLVNIPKLRRALSDVYRRYSNSSDLFTVLKLSIPSTSLDINVSPDKATIFICQENRIIEALKEYIPSCFNSTQVPTKLIQTDPVEAIPKPISVREASKPIHATEISSSKSNDKNNIAPMLPAKENLTSRDLNPDGRGDLAKAIVFEGRDSSEPSELNKRQKTSDAPLSSSSGSISQPFKLESRIKRHVFGQYSTGQNPDLHKSKAQAQINKASILSVFAEISKNNNDIDIRRSPDLKTIDEIQSDISNAQAAEKILHLTVHKTDFQNMRIVGQFNRGFILVVSKNDTMGRTDLLIIDQHASDEKSTYERLKAETIFDSQLLLKPIELELTAIEELTVADNIKLIERKGFRLKYDELRPVGQRFKLIAMPISKETQFNEKDAHELIQILCENPFAQLQCSKVEKMLAMRACRSSIMIGTALDESTMSKIVRNLGKLDQPWNCPHGRPTMRHLLRLDELSIWKQDLVSFL